MESCPFCGSRGCCVRFASYKRIVVDFVDGLPVDEEVRVPRIRCRSCGRTHAILTDHLIPYRSYSLFFILRVIGEYLLRLRPVEKLCARFWITHSTLYRWITLFRALKAEWPGLLQDLERGEGFCVRRRERGIYDKKEEAGVGGQKAYHYGPAQ